MYRLICGAIILLGLSAYAIAAGNGPFNPVSIGPSNPHDGAGITPLSGLNGTSLVLLAQPGNVYKIFVSSRTATAGNVILYNATAAPSPGALTAGLVLWCSAIPASGTANVDFSPPAAMSVGATVLVTSGNCATYTTGVISADVFGNAL